MCSKYATSTSTSDEARAPKLWVAGFGRLVVTRVLSEDAKKERPAPEASDHRCNIPHNIVNSFDCISDVSCIQFEVSANCVTTNKASVRRQTRHANQFSSPPVPITIGHQRAPTNLRSCSGLHKFVITQRLIDPQTATCWRSKTLIVRVKTLAMRVQ